MIRKILIALIAIAAAVVGFIAGCGDPTATSVELTPVSFGFHSRVINTPSGGVTLQLIPNSPGAKGDGFKVYYQEKEYFLPEGTTEIKLHSDRQYRIFVSRVILVEGEIIENVLEETPMFVGVNEDKETVAGDTLNLALYPYENTPRRLLVAPRIEVNFREAGFKAWTSIYQGPPTHYDAVEARFGAFIRTGIQPVSVIVPVSPGRSDTTVFREPSGAAYTELVVRARIDDPANKRTIVSEWSPVVEFTR